jgi:hypothetical protein
MMRLPAKFSTSVTVAAPNSIWIYKLFPTVSRFQYLLEPEEVYLLTN